MLRQFLLGIIRHCLTYGGGLLTAQGWGTASDWDQLIGAAITILGIAWSIWEKRDRHPAPVTPAPIATTPRNNP